MTGDAQARFDNWKLDQVATLMAEREARSVEGWEAAEAWLVGSNRHGFEIDGPSQFTGRPGHVERQSWTRYRFELDDDQLDEVRRRARVVSAEIFGGRP